MLTLVDDHTRECPVIEVDTSLGGVRMCRVLDRVAGEQGLPEPSFWMTGRIFVVEPWRLGAGNTGSGWSSFSTVPTIPSTRPDQEKARSASDFSYQSRS
jgi:hypothetical protein